MSPRSDSARIKIGRWWYFPHRWRGLVHWVHAEVDSAVDVSLTVLTTVA